MRTNLLLLAGRGKRFADAGYKLPKPLIEVDGLPLVVSAARSLPPADKLIFVVSGDYISNHEIEQ
jgi:NDP-sugar pyrophosphorylase family protein